MVAGEGGYRQTAARGQQRLKRRRFLWGEILGFQLQVNPGKCFRQRRYAALFVCRQQVQIHPFAQHAQDDELMVVKGLFKSWHGLSGGVTGRSGTNR